MLELRLTNKYGDDLEGYRYHTIEDIIEDMKINIAEGIDCYIYDPLLKRTVAEYQDGEVYDPLELLI